jgi:ATP-binding cassette subfamily B protein IrtB
MNIRGVIALIESVLGAPSGLRLQTVGFALTGILQGLSLVTLIPLLRKLLDNDLAGAVGWTGLGVLAFILSGVVHAVTSRRGIRTGVFGISEGITKKLADHVIGLPMGWFTGERAGQFSTLTADAQAAATFAGMVLQQTVIAVTTPLTVVAVVTVVDWRLGLSFLVLVPAGVLAYNRIQRVQAPARAEEATSLAEVAGRILEFAQAQPLLRASGAKDADLLDRALDEDRRTTVRTQNRTLMPMTIYTAVVQVGVALVLVVAAGMVIHGWIDAPAVIAVLLLVLRFTEPLTLIGAYGTGVQLAATGLLNIREVLDTPALPEPDHPVSPESLPDTSVRFDDVTFGYDGAGRAVLDGFTLALEPGTMTALVGPSGAGKSTVLRLAARFWDADSGHVRIGGADVRDLSGEGLMSLLSMVFQHVYLFDDTILENVRLARPDARTDEVMAAARAARLDEVVDRLPAGWNTTVGEGGERLSGGERQRVSLARAFLKDAPVLLLDEVTAALDAENESLVSAAIHELAKDRTVLIVAHRLSTIARADTIAFLEDGRVVESGTQDELLAAGGRYREFWDARTASAKWTLSGE